MYSLLDSECSRFIFIQFLDDKERIKLSEVDKYTKKSIEEYIPGGNEFRTITKPKSLVSFFSYEKQCYRSLKPSQITFSGLYFYLSMCKHENHLLYLWMKHKIQISNNFKQIIRKVKPNTLEYILLVGIIQDFSDYQVENIIRERMIGNIDDTFVSTSFSDNQWEMVKKYLDLNKSIEKLILTSPFENDTIISYFLDNKRPLKSLDVSGDVCFLTFQSVISCIPGLKELKIRDMDSVNYHGIIQEVVENNTIESLTIENTMMSSDICYLLKNNKLKELHVIDTFPAFPIDLISSIGSSKLEKLSIKTSIKHRINKSSVDLISSIPLFNTNLTEFDFNGVDMSNVDKNTLSGVIHMKNLKKIGLSYTNLSSEAIESICHAIVDSNIKHIELEGIEIGVNSRLLFDSIRLNVHLTHVNLNNSVIIANSYEALRECRSYRRTTRVTTNGCFVDPLIQRLF